MRFVRQRWRPAMAVVMAAVLALLLVMVSAFLVLNAARSPGQRASATPSTAASPQASATPLPPGKDWTQFRFDVNGTGENPEGLISSQNLNGLTRRWTTDLHSPFAAAPAIVKGVIYITHGDSLYAFDLHSGVQLWHYDGPKSGYTLNSSAVAVDAAARRAYFGTPDALVKAINIDTGKLVWRAKLGDPAQGAHVWDSPLLVNGKLYIGLASHNDDPCVRGSVFALNPATGKTIWAHYTAAAGVTGGGVWSSLTAIPSLKTLVATTGNPCLTDVDSDQEDSIVGLNWDTGATRWVYHAGLFPGCDCDFGEGAVNFVLNGKQYVVGGNKYGSVYALVVTGNSARLAWTKRIATIDSVSRNLYGGIFQPPAYHDGIVFVAGGTTPDKSCSGSLWAFQATTGNALWHTCTKGRVFSAGAIAGGMYFVAQNGVIVGYEMTSGRVAWQASTKGGFYGGVAISNGHLVGGSISGILYCFALVGAP
ncbi:MAG TPA: PQQ-binding-like beta-propeller repeat protein [Ktedonobacterales bacterium]|nr:PQQ-binding-like beta-propeller repeat protein [Ktedonobacterales bacterium]